MRFRDIPQFTDCGTYEIDVPITFIEKNLADYEKTYGLELNPDFQRGHVWSEEQQTAYLEFFLKGGKSARVIYFNCPQFGRVTKECDMENMVLVDGLQRLTAIRAFLNDEIPVFGHYFSEYEDNNRITTLYALKFHVNDLQTKADVLKWYIEMNSGGVVHSKEEIARVKGLLDAENKKKEKRNVEYESKE